MVSEEVKNLCKDSNFSINEKGEDRISFASVYDRNKKETPGKNLIFPPGCFQISAQSS